MNVTLTTGIVFNAGLVLIASLLVSPRKVGEENSPADGRWKFLRHTTIYLNKAVGALQNLDQGNRVVQRIVDYLSQLTLAVLSLRECSSTSLSRPVHHPNHEVKS